MIGNLLEADELPQQHLVLARQRPLSQLVVLARVVGVDGVVPAQPVVQLTTTTAP